ncbi:MSC_0623 family F1-like ATPase-associated protein [Mycoplasma elephantis]|uniref:MSC_0623 family F1-like ATPase-associated protein n=1 Tax=Mycoplasma elephantis TaxID=114882 RepID=UPI000486F491|nr:DUF2714 domain-containing protein [Mycoplasma elephantis]
MKKKENNAKYNFYSDYENYITLDNFISYDKLLATSLFKSKVNFESDIYEKFKKNIDLAIYKKWNLVFKDFVISFNIDPKYGNNTLVPVLIKNEQTNSEAINFIPEKENDGYNSFLEILNNELSFLLNNMYIVELIPGLIVFISKNTKNKKVLFSEKFALPFTR